MTSNLKMESGWFIRDWVRKTVSISYLAENLGAAVAILEGRNAIQGVVRFLQLTSELCLIEGTIDGLEPGLHGFHVHQFGDLTRDCNR